MSDKRKEALTRFGLLISLLCLILSGCSTGKVSELEITPTIEETESLPNTPTSTYTPSPTDTPTHTDTPLPTPTPSDMVTIKPGMDDINVYSCPNIDCETVFLVEEESEFQAIARNERWIHHGI